MIEFKDVSFAIEGEEKQIILEHINLNIHKGEMVVVCGKSGCGKTTITRLVNGLIPHYYEGKLTGEVWVEGKEIKEQDLPQISKIVGSVFQNPRTQFFNVDTTNEIAFGCENQGLAREDILQRIDETAKAFDLERLMGRNIFELSGGEKQQIACGLVYAAQPKIYVLDEPSSNLDQEAINRLREILKCLKDEGATILIAEHRLYYLKDLADRYVYMDSGKIQKIYSKAEMNAISIQERENMGLRLLDLRELSFKTKENKKLKEEGLHITNFSCKRRNGWHLEIPDLSFEKKAIVAVIGKNGEGKSTFVDCISGMQKHKGKFYIEQQSFKRRNRIKNSYMVMQEVNHQLFCESVLEEVKLNVAEINHDKVTKILEQLELKEVVNRHPMSLSGGQKQRLALAAALCANKKILIYDEPTSGLDYINMQQCGKLIKKAGEDATLSFVITHDPELVLECCTHVLYLKSGKVCDFYELNEETADKLRGYYYKPLAL